MCESHEDCPGCVLCPIRSKGLFDGLSRETLAVLESGRRLRLVDKSEVVFYEGEPSSHMFCLHRGTVKLYRTTPAGEVQILRLLGPGEPLGHRDFFAGRPYSCTAQALSPCELCCFERSVLMSLSIKEPLLVQKIISRLSDELLRLENRLIDTIHKSVRERVASLLLELTTGNKSTVETPFSRLELAQMVGTTPETMARILSLFQRQGAIEKTRRVIRVIDRTKLQRLAGERA